MNKITFCLFILTFCASASFAQTLVTDDYHKFEVFGGYSNNQVDVGISDDNEDIEDFFQDREGFNGFNASAVGNVNRFLGVKGDFSAHFKSFRFDVPRVADPTVSDRFEVDGSLYNFLGGVQVKDNRIEGSRVRPFGHALIGVAHGRSEVDNDFFSSEFCAQPGIDCREEVSESSTGFAAALGGGIDIKATDRLSIRAIQVDYNPTRLNDTTQHNFRFGVGLVFH